MKERLSMWTAGAAIALALSWIPSQANATARLFAYGLASGTSGTFVCQVAAGQNSMYQQ